MPKGIKPWIAGGVAVALIGCAALILRQHRVHEQARRQSSAAGPTSRGLATDFGAPTLPVVPETKEQIAAEVTASLGAWRQAILVKDADTVMALDRAFIAAPDRYGAALAESAKSES